MSWSRTSWPASGTFQATEPRSARPRTCARHRLSFRHPAPVGLVHVDLQHEPIRVLDHAHRGVRARRRRTRRARLPDSVPRIGARIAVFPWCRSAARTASSACGDLARDGLRVPPRGARPRSRGAAGSPRHRAPARSAPRGEPAAPRALRREARGSSARDPWSRARARSTSSRSATGARRPRVTSSCFSRISSIERSARAKRSARLSSSSRNSLPASSPATLAQVLGDRGRRGRRSAPSRPRPRAGSSPANTASRTRLAIHRDLARAPRSVKPRTPSSTDVGRRLERREARALDARRGEAAPLRLVDRRRRRPRGGSSSRAVGARGRRASGARASARAGRPRARRAARRSRAPR